MPKPKRKLTRAQKRARKKRREEFMTVFMNGKQRSESDARLRLMAWTWMSSSGGTPIRSGCIRMSFGSTWTRPMKGEIPKLSVCERLERAELEVLIPGSSGAGPDHWLDTAGNSRASGR